MTKDTTSTRFEVLINDSFIKIASKQFKHSENKKVLSLANDFEDGKWRYENFNNYIWDNIALTALSFKERESLIDKSHSLLAAAAKNIRLLDSGKEEIGKGSELAEILLYGIMKDYYQSLPVVPKIFYKQNTQDYAKGADSVHIVIEDNSDFALWFGEAKFYNTIEDARLDTIVNSVNNLLQTDKLKKENCILTSVSDLSYVITDKELKDKIIRMLSAKASIDELKPKLNISILLLYECGITAKHKEMSQKYKDDLIVFHMQRAEAYFKKQVEKLSDKIHKYSEIRFHIILFPVPEKKEVVDRFIANVQFFKKQ